MACKIIVVTGGVYSSLGKGIIASSIGCILKNANYKICMMKLDPYLNINPGTLSPYQHGEVFVTDDGCETDLDLGHYERFTNSNLTHNSSITSGKIYFNVLSKERTGFYNGKTVQVIPHITGEIQEKIYSLIKETKPDFLIIEIGGTIGDIESLPFIESLRILSNDYGRDNILFVHASPLFQLSTTNELKTKPTQHSIKNLRNLGIFPKILVLRNNEIISKEDKEKISWTCDIDLDNIFVSKDCKSIYEVPKILYEQGIHESIFKNFKIKSKKVDMLDWNKFLESISNEKLPKLEIGLIGKYTKLSDSYLSVIESLKIAAASINLQTSINLIESTNLNHENYIEILSKQDCIIVPGGFGKRGISGMEIAVQYARENNVPFLGICLGMQVAILETCRNILKLENFGSTEFEKDLKYKIFEENKVEKNDNSLRLGVKEIKVSENSLAHKIYNKNIISERHRHRYSFNHQYLNEIEKAGLTITGFSEDRSKIVEIVENKNLDFFMAVQFHPEFLTRPNNPAPIFVEFLKKTNNKKRSK